ncbi:hypothetical protein [Vulcanococcus limneticus]|uniref:hypothetical protein n=1 Tax=Vulcanococcus limneticus TaxID=2170428 RepID=UPI00398C23C3
MSASPSSPPPAAARPLDPSPLPPWMRWLGTGLTAMVAVLFLVLLQQVRQQAGRLEALQGRVQSLENARDLERTNALEEQLRSTVQRLHRFDGLEGAVEELQAQQESLRQQLRQRPATPGPQSPSLLPREDLGGGLTPLAPGPAPARPAAPPQP